MMWHEYATIRVHRTLNLLALGCHDAHDNHQSLLGNDSVELLAY